MSSVEVLMKHAQACIRECEACELRAQCSGPVPGEGFYDARFVIFGRNPGITEDRYGRPFIGRGGAVLWDELAKNSLYRNDFYITNMVKCYTQGDSPPTEVHREKCKDWWALELGLLKPLFVVAFGNDAFSALMEHPVRVLDYRKQYFIHRLGFVFMPAMHPGAAVRRTDWRDQMNDDLAYTAATIRDIRALIAVGAIGSNNLVREAHT